MKNLIIFCIFVVGLGGSNYPLKAEAITVAPLYLSHLINNRIMETKICSKCGVEKSVLLFSKRNDRPIGYNSSCKKCKEIQTKLWYRTPKGLLSVIYTNQIKSSRKRKHELPKYTKIELYTWALSQDDFNQLFNKWESSGYQKELIPSIDRLEDTKGYSFNNIRLVTFETNNKKSHLDMRSGKLITKFNPQVAIEQFDLKGNFIASFISMSEASRQTGIRTSYIARVCNGSRAYTKGFVFKIIEPPRRRSLDSEVKQYPIP